MKIFNIFLSFWLISYQALASVTFDSTDSTTACGTADIIKENAAWTVCTWINPTVDTSGGGDPRVFDKGGVFGAIAATKYLYIQVTGGTSEVHRSVDNTISFNTWQWVCFTDDGTTTATGAKIYLNGSEVTYFSTGTNGVTPTDNSAGTLVIGNRGDGTRPIGGQLTNTTVWDGTALSSAVIGRMYYAMQNKYATLEMGTFPTRFYPMMEKPVGTNANGVTIIDMTGGANCTATDGTGGMSYSTENFLTYPED